MEEVAEEHNVEVSQVVDHFRIDFGEHDNEELKEAKKKVDDINISKDNEKVAEPAPNHKLISL